MGEHADLLAVETVPCLAEVEAVLAELDGSGVPAWLSLSTANGLTRAGEPIGEAFAMAADVAEVVAVGVNCSSPADAGAAVPVAGAHGPAVVYPNSGQGWNAATRSWEGALGVRPGRRRGLGGGGRAPRRRVLPRRHRATSPPCGPPSPAPTSRREHHQPLGGAGHRDVAVHRAGHAVPEAVGVDEHHEVELEALDQLGRERADATAPPLVESGALATVRRPVALDDHRRALGVLGQPVLDDRVTLGDGRVEHGDPALADRRRHVGLGERRTDHRLGLGHHLGRACGS